MTQRDELEQKHFPQGGVSQRKLDLMWRLSDQAMWEAAHGGGVTNDDCARILVQTYDELASLVKPDEVDRARPLPETPPRRIIPENWTGS